MTNTHNTPKTLLEAVKYYADFEHCKAVMIEARWPDGIVRCPTCGSDHVTYMANTRRWKCYGKHTRPQFSLKVGTIFEDSPLGLDKWLVAVWLLADSKNGISSCELGRALGVTQKTAWFMLHRVRKAMQAGTRKLDDAARFKAVLGQIVDKRLTYDELIGKAAIGEAKAGVFSGSRDVESEQLTDGETNKGRGLQGQ